MYIKTKKQLFLVTANAFICIVLLFCILDLLNVVLNDFNAILQLRDS